MYIFYHPSDKHIQTQLFIHSFIQAISKAPLQVQKRKTQQQKLLVLAHTVAN